MDPVRIESYLRAACSVLDFDIGELWCATMLPDQKPSLRFISKYKTPTYEDFYALLVEPRLSLRAQTHSQREEDKHGFSPIICRGVCDGGQIVWANTHLSEGLNGRTDLPLNTAVGVPICSLAGELYILVLFAVGIVSVTPHAMEFLTTLARAIAEPTQTDTSSEMDTDTHTDTHIDTHTNTNNDTLSSTTLTSLPQSAEHTHTTHKSGFLSAALASHPQPVTRARTEDFVGRYAINELIQRYAHEVEFHLLPMHKLQRFFDCNEIMLFCDLFMDFKLSRDGKFTRKQLQSLRETYARERERERSGSCGSEESGAWDLGDRETQKTAQPENAEDGEGEDLAGLFLNDELSLCAPTQQQPAHTTQTSQTKQTTQAPHTAQETQGPGAYCVDLNSIVAPLSTDTHSPHAHTTQIHTHSGLALEISPGLPKSSSHNTQSEEDDRTQPTRLTQPTEPSPTDAHEQHTSILHIYAHMTYKLSQCRFHEFLIAVVGMTVFEAAEMWLVSEHGEPHTLTLVAAVYRSPAMQPWIARSESLRLQVPSDGKAPLFGPAKVVDSGHSDWDSDVTQLNAETSSESHDDNPNSSPTEQNEDSTQRVRTARACGVRTSLGIPLQGLRGVCGALMFYTSLTTLCAEPLLVQFLECAVSLLASSSLQESSWTRLEDKVALAMREQHTQTQAQSHTQAETEQHTQGGTETGTQLNHEHASMICESVCESALPREENAHSGENLAPANDDQTNNRAQCPPMQRWLSEAHALPLSSHTSAAGSSLSGEMPAPPARTQAHTQAHTQPHTLALPLTKRMASSHIDLTQISAQSERESLPPSLATQLIIDKKLSTFDQRVRFWRNTLTDRAQPNGNGTHTTVMDESVQNNTMTTTENENTPSAFSDENKTIDVSTDAPTGTVPRARSRSSLSLALDPQSLSSINPYTYHILQQQQQHNTPYTQNTQQHALLSLSAAATAAIMRSNPSLVALANAPQTLTQTQTNTSSSAHPQASSTAGAGFVFRDGVRVGDTLGEDWNDHVVNAAITLANFGKVSSASADIAVSALSMPVCVPVSSTSGHYNSGALGVSTPYTSTAVRNNTGMEWSSFLEGSNNGVNFRCALDSHKVLAAAQDYLPQTQTLSGHKRGFTDASSENTQSLPKCKVEDCPHTVESATVHYCTQHRGTRRCQKEGCHKCAQGATRFCIAHGGGRRCTYPGCTKGARDKFFCAAHGGGKRCSQAGCTKSAVGGSDLCTAHGGGKRCQYPGCTKSSQSSTRFCVRHGGGKCCAFEGCTKVARGKTNYCASHGGGVRCRFASCNKLAVGAQQLCRTHQSLSSEEQALLPPLVHVDEEDYEGGEGDEEFSVSVKEEAPMLAHTCAAPKKRKSGAK